MILINFNISITIYTMGIMFIIDKIANALSSLNGILAVRDILESNCLEEAIHFLKNLIEKENQFVIKGLSFNLK